MAQINLGRREVNCKIVYYGPGLSGKTTNLEQVYGKLPGEHKGRLTSISTEGDRTLFFDFLPIDIGTVRGMTTKFQIYTVPGQTFYRSTRKLVLQGADGVIFVADSAKEKLEENIQSLEDLHANLAAQGLELNRMPFVIQYNKRDLPDALDVAVLQENLNKLCAPHFEASAVHGEGVIPTLKELSRMVLDNLNGSSAGPTAGQVPPAVEEVSVEQPAAPKVVTQPAPPKPSRTAVPAMSESKRSALGGAGAASESAQKEVGKAAGAGEAAARHRGAPGASAGPAGKAVRPPVSSRPAARAASNTRPVSGRAPGVYRRTERSGRRAAVKEERGKNKKKIIVIFVLAGLAAAAVAAAVLL